MQVQKTNSALPADGPHPRLLRQLRGQEAHQLQAAAKNAVALIRSMANPERLMLLCALVDGERCVSELSQATGIRQPTLSQQLAVLREESLVATRREGKFVHYRVASAPALEVLAVLHRLYCGPTSPEPRPS